MRTAPAWDMVHDGKFCCPGASIPQYTTSVSTVLRPVRSPPLILAGSTSVSFAYLTCYGIITKHGLANDTII